MSDKKYSDYIVYVDESGDHGLDSIDSNYPIFVLAFCIFKKTDYARVISPAIQEFKFKCIGEKRRMGAQMFPLKNKRPRVSPKPVADRDFPVQQIDYGLFLNKSNYSGSCEWAKGTFLLSARLGSIA